MARSAFPIVRNWPSVASAALVLVLTLGTLLAVALRAEAGMGLGAADWAAIRFTIFQAALSAFFSVLGAVPLARALARRRFFGRGALITLLGAPFLLPVIVAVLGLLAVFGRGGIVSAALGWFGLPPLAIYGLHGVVLAHVFLNLPLATRLILQGWQAVPAERFRLAESLNAPVGVLIERPMLRQVLPGAALVIFLICLTSFAVALTLGGGPKATTVELAIYQALRFDFDLGRAALLACVQFGLCAAAAGLTLWVSLPTAARPGLDRGTLRWDHGGRIADGVIIALGAAFLMVPLGMVVLNGVPGLLALPDQVWPAALRSICVALVSSGLCVAMALSLALRGGWMAGMIGVLPLAASSLVVGTGAFLIVYPFISPRDVALPMTAMVNALLALPFALRSLAPEAAQLRADYDRLAETLGLRGIARLRLLVLPRLRRPLGFALGLAAALSMGDLGVITLFAGDGQATLPLVMFRLMGAYQMQAAAGAGLLLLGCSLMLFWLFDKWGRGHVDA